MDLLPAIDLMGGEVVRLKQGKAEEKTVYSSDPASFAKQWEQEGGDWLHLVDLDGAFNGKPQNLESVKKIVQAISIPCELGGGMREVENIKAALDIGVSRVILGSKACTDEDFVKECLEKFGSEKIAIGIDAKDGKVATKGWVETSTVLADELAARMSQLGVGTIIYTDIATDGMLKGPNFGAMRSMSEKIPATVIASGGVSSDEDILELSKISDLKGIIIGKALYEGKVDLKQCRSNIG